MPKQVDPSLQMKIHQYIVYGRKLPTETDATPQVVAFRVFAKNENFARSQFWKLNKNLHKFKASQGEIVRVQRITERNVLGAKNYGIYFRYRTRTGQMNTFKEFRAVSLEAALSELYSEMGSKQKVTKESISIVKVCTLRKDDLSVRNQRAIRFVDTASMKIAHWRRRFRPEDRQYRCHFSAKRPTVFKTGKSITK